MTDGHTPSAEIAAVTNAAGILEMRASGNESLLPPQFAKFTDAQVTESILMSAARLLDHYRAVEAAQAAEDTP